MCTGLRVKYLLFLSDFSETGICKTDFQKKDIKFHEKSIQWEPSCPVQTDGEMDRQT